MEKIKKILTVDLNSFPNVKSFTDYIDKNIGSLKKNISLMSLDELKEIRVLFFDFATKNKFYTEFYNSDYNDSYGYLVKIGIRVELSSNNISQVVNYLSYLKKSEKNKAYVHKIEALRLFRLLKSPKDDLPKNFERIINNLVKSRDYGENFDDLVLVLREYFSRLFSLSDYSESIEKRNDFFNSAKSFNVFSIFLENKSFLDFLNNFLVESSEDDSAVEDKNIQIINDLKIKKDKDDVQEYDLNTFIKSIKIAVIGGDIQSNNIHKINNNFSEFSSIGLEKKQIEFFDAWKDSQRTPIDRLKKYDIIVIGENDHVWKDMPGSGAKAALSTYLESSDFKKDRDNVVYSSPKNLSQTQLKKRILDGVKTLKDRFEVNNSISS